MPPLKLDPFTLSRADIELWPRRLLHVPSMTSMERTTGDFYGTVEKPSYNILSYTWGRYRVLKGPSLPVFNVSWDIPSIDDSHFNVAEFENAIREVSRGVSFIWLDIACIDQENQAVKMSEIGNQAGIFNNANAAYVWLTRISIIKLQGILDGILEAENALGGDLRKTVNLSGNPDDDMTFGYADADWTAGIETDAEIYCPPCLQDLTWISKTSEVLNSLLEDPWFTSLWTLQELFLRPDAHILSLEAIEPKKKGFLSFTLMNLFMSLGEMDEVITARALRNRGFREGCTTETMRGLGKIVAVIQRFGIHAWDNPSTLYNAASFRTTVEPMDRVYGIMQIFGFRLGQSQEPNRQFSLDELETQFAASINAQSPIWAQLFVHPSVVPLGTSWRVHTKSVLPPPLQLAITAPSSSCSIRLDTSQRPVFRGQACKFGDLNRVWQKHINEMVGESFWGWKDALQLLLLDATDLTQQVPENLRDIKNEDRKSNQDLSDFLGRTFEQSLRVLHLGYLCLPDLVEESGSDNESETPPGASVGLLVQPLSFQGRMLWQRVGISIWVDVPDSETEREPSLWTRSAYQLG